MCRVSSSPRRFAEPERNGRRHALRILDPHLAALYPQNAIRGIAELEHITGDTFHGEIFVDAADVQALGFEQHAVVGVVRNGAAAGHGGQLRATPATQGATDGVAVQVGAADALTAVVTLGEHAQQGLIVFFVEIAIRPRSAEHRQQRVLRPFLATDLGNDLLRQHV